MEKTIDAECVNIQLTRQANSVTFQLAQKLSTVPPATVPQLVAIQFDNSKEAAEFEIGTVYSFVITNKQP